MHGRRSREGTNLQIAATPLSPPVPQLSASRRKRPLWREPYVLVAAGAVLGAVPEGEAGGGEDGRQRGLELPVDRRERCSGEACGAHGGDLSMWADRPPAGTVGA